jgi:hypothetical protein
MLCLRSVDGSEMDDIAGAFIGGGGESRGLGESASRSSVAGGLVEQDGDVPCGRCKVTWPPGEMECAARDPAATKCDQIVAVMWLATDV